MFVDDAGTQNRGVSFLTGLMLVSIPATITLIGTIVSALMSWLKDRDTISQRIRIISEAKTRVEFWQTWITSIEPISSDKEMKEHRELARTHLISAAEIIRERPSLRQEWIAKREHFLKYRDSLSWWRRALLIYKSPSTVSQKLYWLMLITTITYLGLTVAGFVILRHSHPAPPRLQHAFQIMVILASCCTVWTVYFRTRVMKIEGELVLYRFGKPESIWKDFPRSMD